MMEKNLKENINTIITKYSEELIQEIEKEGLSDKVNEGIRIVHHLVQIKENLDSEN